jgi:hypothetical protein
LFIFSKGERNSTRRCQDFNKNHRPLSLLLNSLKVVLLAVIKIAAVSEFLYNRDYIAIALA